MITILKKCMYKVIWKGTEINGKICFLVLEFFSFNLISAKAIIMSFVQQSIANKFKIWFYKLRYVDACFTDDITNITHTGIYILIRTCRKYIQN